MLERNLFGQVAFMLPLVVAFLPFLANMQFKAFRLVLVIFLKKCLMEDGPLIKQQYSARFDEWIFAFDVSDVLEGERQFLKGIDGPFIFLEVFYFFDTPFLDKKHSISMIQLILLQNILKLFLVTFFSLIFKKTD